MTDKKLFQILVISLLMFTSIGIAMAIGKTGELIGETSTFALTTIQCDTMNPSLESQAIISDIQTADVDVWVDAGTHHHYYASRPSGAGMYGSFSVTSGNDIDFFICDDYNYNEWNAGRTASVYHLQEHVGSYSWQFRTPTTDTWHVVYSNEYSIITSKHVIGAHYLDKTPPEIDLNLENGVILGGTRTIGATITEGRFSIGTVKLYIDGALKKTEYDSSFSYAWDTTYYTNGVHTIRLEASDNVGNTDDVEITVYVSNTAPGTSSGLTGGTMPLTLIGPMLTIFVLFIVCIGIVGIMKRSRGGEPSGAVPVEVVGLPPKPDTTVPEKPAESKSEREIIRERVLVVCPYCGAKNEQGALKCHNCEAKL